MATITLKDGCVIEATALDDVNLRPYLESKATSIYNKDFNDCNQDEQLEVIDVFKKEFIKLR